MEEKVRGYAIYCGGGILGGLWGYLTQDIICILLMPVLVFLLLILFNNPHK